MVAQVVVAKIDRYRPRRRQTKEDTGKLRDLPLCECPNSPHADRIEHCAQLLDTLPVFNFFLLVLPEGTYKNLRQPMARQKYPKRPPTARTDSQIPQQGSNPTPAQSPRLRANASSPIGVTSHPGHILLLNQSHDAVND